MSSAQRLWFKERDEMNCTERGDKQCGVHKECRIKQPSHDKKKSYCHNEPGKNEMLVRLKPIYITATYTVKATLGSMKVARVSSCYTFLIEMHTGVHNTSHSCLQSCNINLLNY